MRDTEPYISFVVTARNDDHGGNLLRRMQIFVTGLIEQTKRHNLSAELILVEWNPVPDRPRLYEALSWPREKGPCKVRVIEVSSDIHKRFRYSDQLALFQMIAKNAGIRRARGRFVLATNIDLLFSDELVAALASRSQDPEAMYRIDRYDVSSDVPIHATVEEQMEYCRRNVIRVNRRDGTFRLNELHWLWLRRIRTRVRTLYGYLLRFLPSRPKITLRPAMRMRFVIRNVTQRMRYEGHLFMRATRLFGRAAWLSMKGYLTPSEVVLAFCFSTYLIFTKISVALGNGIDMLSNSCSALVGNMSKSSVSFFVGRASLFSRGARLLRIWLFPIYPRLHTNGCGDFTLMAREHWHALRGYPELEMFSFNLDSVLCHMAYQLGVREEVFRDPMRIYHVEHTSGWTPEGESKMIERLRVMSIPMLDFRQFESWATKMQKERRPMILNDEGWGLASEQLPERVIE